MFNWSSATCLWMWLWRGECRLVVYIFQILFDDIRDIYILRHYLPKWKKALHFTQNYTSLMAWFLTIALVQMHEEQQCKESSGDVAILWTLRAEAAWQELPGHSSCLKGMQYYHKFKEISVKWECSPVEKWFLAILFFQREDKGGECLGSHLEFHRWLCLIHNKIKIREDESILECMQEHWGALSTFCRGVG